MIPFPDITPEIFTIHLFGMAFSLRWYALAYLVGLILGWRILVWLMRRPALWGDRAPMRPEQAEELLTWVVLGVFVMGYGLSRFVVEFFRQADAQFITPDNPLGHVIGGPVWGLSMGQVLSLPMTWPRGLSGVMNCASA